MDNYTGVGDEVAFGITFTSGAAQKDSGASSNGYLKGIYGHARGEEGEFRPHLNQGTCGHCLTDHLD